MTVQSLLELLSSRAQRQGDKCAFSFVRGEIDDRVSKSYRELHRRAMAIAGELQACCQQGDTALLLFPPGLEFIEAFFGCLYAGVVAVPVSPPRGRRVATSLAAIVDVSQPRVVLSTKEHLEQTRPYYKEVAGLPGLPWLATDAVPESRANAWREPPIQGRDVAFLQFTSGSTSWPKGVMLSHDNLLSNSAMIGEAFGASEESKAVFWLPLYHDMGLIGGVIQPVFCGGSCTLFAPAAFLQRPTIWLELISRERATISGGPDFAYDLCARKIPAGDCEKFDLSSWEVAFTGAETIRSRTLDRFTAAFGPRGFRRESFFPCYGLAESTLIVSGGPRQRPPVVINVDADELRADRIHQIPSDQNGRRVVSCGLCLAPQRVEIVNPKTFEPCGEARVGEIWVQGPSVALGYYRRSDATRATFHAQLADGGEGPFLRTGDLGFLQNGELHVTGRLKDLIVIRGRNYYPEDIEQTVEEAHPSFRVGHCVAFSIDIDDQERLVVVQEIEPRVRSVDCEGAFQAVRRAIAATYQLEVYAIVLAKAGANPKTSSGKRRRSAARKSFLTGRMDAHGQWIASLQSSSTLGIELGRVNGARVPEVRDVREWLVRRIAAQLGLPVARIHTSTPFLELGMGSLDAMEVATDLQTWLGRQLLPTAVYNHPSIDSLAQWLAEPPAESTPTTDPASDLKAAVAVSDEDLLREVQTLSEAEMEAYIFQEMAKQGVPADPT